MRLARILAANHTSGNGAAIVPGTQVLRHKNAAHCVDSLIEQMRDVGVGRERRLMVLARKSVETVALVHACLTARIVFVLVDPDAPAERLRFILNDCAPQATVRIGLIILILSGLSLPYSRPPTAGRGSVTACSKTDQHTIRGDTVDVRYLPGSQFSVRWLLAARC